MKKTSIILTSLVCITTVFGLASCNDGGGGDPAIYNITYEENDNYRVIDFDSQGQEGSNILFDVESTSVFYEIGEVTYNGTPISRGALGYQFIMPGEDVVIKIELEPITEYDDPNDYLSWNSSVIDEISMASEEDKGYEYLDCVQNLTLDFDMAEFGSYNSVDENNTEVLSSNQDVIPNSAISFDPIKESDLIGSSGSNVVRGGSIRVDLKQINPGTATIYAHLSFNNADDATLMRTFTVTEYGKVEVETWNVPYTVINETSYDDLENIQISITDQDYVYGSNAPQYQGCSLDELVDGKGTLVFAVGHSYSVRANYAVWNEEDQKYETTVALDVYDWTGRGSSTSGFNQIKNGILTLVSLPTDTNPIQITIDN